MIKRRAKSTVATFLAIAAMTVSFSAYAGELTVTDTKTRENAVVYTLDDLTAMPETEFATSTIWTEGVNTLAHGAPGCHHRTYPGVEEEFLSGLSIMIGFPAC